MPQVVGPFYSPKGRKLPSSRTDSWNIAVKMKLNARASRSLQVSSGTGRRWVKLRACLASPGKGGKRRVALLRNLASGLPLLVVSDLGQHRPCCLCGRGESAFSLQLLQFVLQWCPRLPRMKRVLLFLLPQCRTRNLCQKEGTAIGSSVIALEIRTENQSLMVTSGGPGEYVCWSKQQNCWEKSL